MILWENDQFAVIATSGRRSKNAKTGKMVQTYILHKEHSPITRRGRLLICGDCPLFDTCYVRFDQAPLSVWKKLQRTLEARSRGVVAGYDLPKHKRQILRELEIYPLRIGSAGDPAMIPAEVWPQILSYAKAGHTGYTHQWRKPHVQGLRKYLMASVEDSAGEEMARSMGWRFFGVRLEGSDIPRGQIECLSESRGLSCAECKLCSGAGTDKTRGIDMSTKPSISIEVHGTKKRHLPMAQA